MPPPSTPATRLASVQAHLVPPSPSSTSAAPPPDWPAALAALKAYFPETQLSLDEASRTRHASSFGSFLPPSPAKVVVHAEKKEDVVEVVRIARMHGVVIIPTGGRTGLEGQFHPAASPADDEPTCCNPRVGEKYIPSSSPSAYSANTSSSSPFPRSTPRPTIHLSLSRMDAVLDVWEQDFQARVQPGVGWASLNEELKERGIKLFFPIDPAPKSEFGGMVGVGGSGTNAVGYGTMRAEWITSLEVVLMDGSVIRTKGPSNRARKSSVGWDTARLFLGSEGTLGIVTELTVRLAPVVPLKVALTSFPSVAQAVSTVVEILTAGLTPTSLELLDGTSIKGLNLAELLPEKLPEEPTVLMRFGNPDDAPELPALVKVAEIVRRNGGKELTIARNEKENEKLWNARKSQYWSQQLLIGEGCRTLITDVCVPISRLAEFVSKSDIYVRESGLVAPIVAHIGDGNVHRAILWKGAPGETAAPSAVEALAKKLVKLAQSLEGTCAGEHGIGLMKRKYLQEELGDGTLALMRRVKDLLDPFHLLNPDKVLYPPGEAPWEQST
ncbi:hypothetical protein JCM11251_002691 [Rhodosporidiobolus azoricus]